MRERKTKTRKGRKSERRLTRFNNSINPLETPISDSTVSHSSDETDLGVLDKGAKSKYQLARGSEEKEQSGGRVEERQPEGSRRRKRRREERVGQKVWESI